MPCKPSRSSTRDLRVTASGPHNPSSPPWNIMSVSVRGLHSAAPGSLFRSADSVARQPRLTCLRFRLISGLERTPHLAAQPRRVLRSVRRHLSGLRAGRRARGAPLDLPARGGHNWEPPDRFLHVLPRHHHVGHLVHLLRRIAGTPLRALPRLPGRPARTSRPLGAQAPRPGSARQGGLGSPGQRHVEAPPGRGHLHSPALLPQVGGLRDRRCRRRPTGFLAGPHSPSAQLRRGAADLR